MIQNMRKGISTVALCATLSLGAGAQCFENPVLPGFFPDPSVCRVGDDYYLVNSSFQYFPGVPLHHSKDLIHWEPIGHCLTRKSQVKLEKIGFWNGIYAPTIRYNDGRYYMVTTNTSDKGNFYVYTDNPAGGWSDPIWVDYPGIDPDLFFDEDGKNYFISARGGGHMYLSEIDIATGKLLTEPKKIWSGTGDRCAEAPHLYKKDGYYYLLIAEGGTEYGHKVVVARSRNIYGPYESNPANPILTHARAGGLGSPIQGTGHGDLIQAHDGSWWMIFLAFRPQTGMHHLLGRETFLAPVSWSEDGWPIVNGKGTVSLSMDCTTLPQKPLPIQSPMTDFSAKKLGYEWNYLCNPDSSRYSLAERPGFLRLKASTITIDKADSPTFVGRRQQHINFEATTCLDISGLKNGSEAGLTTYMSNDFHYDLAVEDRVGKKFLVLSYKLSNLRHIEKEIPLSVKTVFLKIEGDKSNYSYYYSTDSNKYEKIGAINTRFLSTETAGGFTGVYLGLFVQSAKDNGSFADFDWFEYIDKSKN